jgi:hypothetical protein
MTEHTKAAIDALEAVVATRRGTTSTAPLGSGQPL